MTVGVQASQDTKEIIHSGLWTSIKDILELSHTKLSLSLFQIPSSPYSGRVGLGNYPFWPSFPAIDSFRDSPEKVSPQHSSYNFAIQSVRQLH
jgi:hypothetical protein